MVAFLGSMHELHWLLLLTGTEGPPLGQDWPTLKPHKLELVSARGEEAVTRCSSAHPAIVWVLGCYVQNAGAAFVASV